MLFSQVLGLPHIKNHLTTTVDRGRIPHAQLFVGPSGSGPLPMAIAYAQYILCGNLRGENTTGSESCNIKMNKLSHPDLHFAFPVAANARVKKSPVSSHFASDWRSFLEHSPYGSLFDWYRALAVENKQGKIGVDEAQDIVKSLSLKSYEGGYKIMIIWMADKMNESCANKLLKLIEEPPEKTLFLLIAEEEDNILQTIHSRCQVLHFPRLNENVIAGELVQRQYCEGSKAHMVARRANGDYNAALQILRQDQGDEQFEQWFIYWVRSAFKAKTNPSALGELLTWSESLSGEGREVQKKFLSYCSEFFRQALHQNYSSPSLVYMEPQTEGFKMENFAPFVHGGNILSITKELEEAAYHIERNGNAKIILTDLSIKLTRLIHKK